MIKKRTIQVTLVGMITLMLINSPTILERYALFFHVDNATKGADAIVILSGGIHTRPRKALDLYKKGYAKKIFITQAKQSINNLAPNDLKIAQGIFLENGILLNTIPSLSNGATSTYDEALDLANYVESNNDIKHIIIVTDSFHTARAFYTFQNILKLTKSDVKIEIAAAANKIKNEKNWWKFEKTIMNYLLEPIKFVYYVIRLNS